MFNPNQETYKGICEVEVACCGVNNNSPFPLFIPPFLILNIRDYTVGKTSLLSMYAKGVFTVDYESYFGPYTTTKKFGNMNVSISLWDTDGTSFYIPFPNHKLPKYPNFTLSQIPPVLSSRTESCYLLPLETIIISWY
jgi:Ras family